MQLKASSITETRANILFLFLSGDNSKPPHSAYGPPSQTGPRGLQPINELPLTPTDGCNQNLPLARNRVQIQSSQAVFRSDGAQEFAFGQAPRSHPTRPYPLRMPLYLLSPFPFLTFDDLVSRLSSQDPQLELINIYSFSFPLNLL